MLPRFPVVFRSVLFPISKLTRGTKKAMLAVSAILGAERSRDIWIRTMADPPSQLEKRLTVTVNNRKLWLLDDTFLIEFCPNTREVGWMHEKLGDVLTIEELATYLKIPKSTLYKLVREGKIPCQKIGRHWRFRKGAIDHWLEETWANQLGSGGDQ
jgi:excisionase family DNA binding protein